LTAQNLTERNRKDTSFEVIQMKRTIEKREQKSFLKGRKFFVVVNSSEVVFHVVKTVGLS
jgi:hypothetical protein